jgi:hypothetical protein
MLVRNLRLMVGKSVWRCDEIAHGVKDRQERTILQGMLKCPLLSAVMRRRRNFHILKKLCYGIFSCLIQGASVTVSAPLDFMTP